MNEAILDFFDEHIEGLEGLVAQSLADSGFSRGRGVKLTDEGSLLGSGLSGAVFSTSAEPVILKLTKDASEAAIAFNVSSNAELQRHPGVVFIFGVYTVGRLKSISQSEVYAIVRENVDPAMPEDWRHPQDPEDPEEYSDEREMAIYQSLDYLVDFSNDWSREVMSARDDYYEELRVLRSIEGCEELADFLGDFADINKTPMTDVHLGNVGYHKYRLSDFGVPQEPTDTFRLCVFDFGFSQYFDEDIPQWMMMTNPAIPRARI